MSTEQARWNLGAKLAAVGLPFLMLGLLTTALTLWVSWQLDGGAASVNEAGRMRMHAYRLAWATTPEVSPGDQEPLLRAFDASLRLLESGDTERPLVTPWDDDVRARYRAVEAAWEPLRQLHGQPSGQRSPQELDDATRRLVEAIDGLVTSIERHLARYTTILHFLQVGLLVLGTVAASVLVVVGYHFVLEPVMGLRRAVARLQAGDLAARVEPSTSDEFGELAVGFNDMARQLQASYAELEQRVREKTSELLEKRERLQSLYEVSLLVAHGGTLQELADGFTQRVRSTLRADAAALRCATAGKDQFVLLASDRLPESMMQDERCIGAGDCLCGASDGRSHTRVIPVRAQDGPRTNPCKEQGWSTILAVPIHVHDRLTGELNLFYHAEVTLPEPDKAMLETLAAHLASGMEALRLQALEREAAVAQERAFLASELHDSIAQSLAFLNIQAQLMRKAMADDNAVRMREALAEIELGLRECHGDVRELLVHFRTRTNGDDLEQALHVTLSKFEHQSGLGTSLTIHGEGLELAADVQVQALHIVQEALSNIRKHASASWVWVDVWKLPTWRIEVRDDGRGFSADDADRMPQTHVGLRIMRERAARLGATLRVRSEHGRGTVVSLTLGSADAPAATPDAQCRPAGRTMAIRLPEPAPPSLLGSAEAAPSGHTPQG